jgi:rRNA maturation endonuclease Nob1|tara:strand:+ start:915 stop:1073 length:159 start_codon:yes stop_codon:yes gene_type:complete
MFDEIDDPLMWKFHCEACDIHMSLIVHNCDEAPVFCPMCGDDMNEEWSEEDV